MCFASLYVPTSGNQGDLTAVEKDWYRYKGVAAITSRRACNGFDVKFNPDSHWSCCFYKGLDILQFKDGSDKMILNRDDQAGFRLDSTYTHKNHKAVCLEGKPELTSHSDYVSKHGGYFKHRLIYL